MKKLVVIGLFILVFIFLYNDMALIKNFVSGSSKKAVTAITNSPTPKPKSNIEKYCEENGITLTAKDVMYNIPNCLDMKFVLKGKAELSNYFNYGFDNDVYYFCMTVKPIGGSYSDQWYVYTSRSSTYELFTDLSKGSCYVECVVEIPESYYKKGQGNMALLRSVSWSSY